MKQLSIIINISNAGIPVWITTHSEAILQQINNMLKLSANKDRKRLMQEYGYQKEDLLVADDIEMYQFEVGGSGRTVLEKLNRIHMGLKRQHSTVCSLKRYKRSRHFRRMHRNEN